MDEGDINLVAKLLVEKRNDIDVNKLIDGEYQSTGDCIEIGRWFNKSKRGHAYTTRLFWHNFKEHVPPYNPKTKSLICHAKCPTTKVGDRNICLSCIERLGTFQDNVDDMNYRDETNGNAKLTNEQREEIRALENTMTQQKIAEIYGVDRSWISRIFFKKHKPS